MTRKLVPLSSLVRTAANPRRNADRSPIEGLSESIRTDGVLQNLVVEPSGDGQYRVVAGTRRLRALMHLRDRGEIDDGYKVPVKIRKDLDEPGLVRLATVENVQREPLDPIDEAEAFAALLQNGAAIEEVAAQTGVSKSTVRRRLALADLCDEVKAAVRAGEVPLSVAEALTLGSIEEQHSVLGMIQNGADVDSEDVRRLLLDGKPTVAAAIFPLKQYTGTYTGDLFAEAETTYFDDAEQFIALQKQAVEQLAKEHGKTAEWVEVLSCWHTPWWQYRKAAEDEPGGTVINLSPSGAVEVRTGLARHPVREEVAEETRAPVEAPKRERRPYDKPTLRYVAAHKSVAVQAALLASPRKAKEVAAVLLLSRGEPGSPVRIDPHPSVAYFAEADEKPKGWLAVDREIERLAVELGQSPEQLAAMSRDTRATSETPLGLYQAVQQFGEEDLDRLLCLLVLVAFGQRDMEALDTEAGLFNQVAQDLGVSMREWWTPDDAFLAGIRRAELDQVAIDSGASLRMGRLASTRKADLVRSLARHFERTANPDAELDEHDQKGRKWLPGAMRFPAEVPASTDTEA